MKITPMFEQYLAAKEENPDALLFFRMGDFYELFFEDAEVAARELQITLTSRNPKDEQKIPMAGVPYHAAEAYLSQLLDKGYKVAICEQVEDPKEAKGLVRREVVRVYTPGTMVEDTNLSAKNNNYLAALWWDSSVSGGGRGALAWLDFSTGEWSGIASRKEPELWQWMVKLGVSELLIPQGVSVPVQYRDGARHVSEVPARSHFDVTSATDRILKAQSVADLTVLDLDDKPELTRCCGALLLYISQTQKQDPNHLCPFSPLNLAEHLLLDEVTEKNLELFRRLDGRTGRGTLWNVVDHTLTPMGGRLLEARLRQPWRRKKAIVPVQETVSLFVEGDSLREEVRSHLRSVYDLERLSTRVFLGRAMPRDFIALRESLTRLPPLRGLLEESLSAMEHQGDTRTESLTGLLRSWDDLHDLCEELTRALVDSPPKDVTSGGLFRTGYNKQLDELITLAENGETLIRQLVEREQNDWDLPTLKLGYNKVYGYYLELTKRHAEKAPEHFERRQTLTNCERFLTPELKELEERMFSATEQRRNLEYELFTRLCDRVAGARPRFMHMAGVVAGLDFWQGLAEAARRNDWTCPEVHDGLELTIEAGRHPVVEAVQGAADFIPNDLRMGENARLLMITGPNMAGKSTVLRQAALICILAQLGSFVPARSARIGLTDRIFSRVGASDNLAGGQSTFMVEMTETARILRQAGKKSLIILDEIGRGTSTFDGMSLAWAVAEELATRHGGVRTLFATHYHELTSLEDELDGVRNFTIAVREYKGDIIFLRKLVPGPSDKSYGIEVAKLAGVPKNVVDRARDILRELEAANGGHCVPSSRASQASLPGMEALAPPAQETAPHPVLQELADLRVDGLTPLQALTLLHDLKQRLDADASPGSS